MRGWRLAAGAMISALVAVSGFAANTLSAGGHDGIVRAQSADMLGLGGFHLGGALEYSQEWDYVHSVTRLGSAVERDDSPKLWAGVGYVAVGLASFMEIGLNLPFYQDRSGFASWDPKGFGDLEASLKLSGIWLRGDEKALTCAYYLALQFPTGDEDEGFFPRHAYYGSEGNWSSGKTIVHPMLIASLHFDRMGLKVPMRLDFNFGGVFNTPEDNEALTASVGFEVSPVEWLALFTEVSAEERITTVHREDFFRDLNNDPIFVTPGIKITGPKTGLYATLAADFGISEDEKACAQTSPGEGDHTVSHQANLLYNAYFALGWQKPAKPKDTDGDGIADRKDKCPEAAEDKDGFQDDDGCPDADNDNDGVVDADDKCPDKAGTTATKGCPDADGDGIADADDKCPNEAEDVDGFQDVDGCPDGDNDGDGIADGSDKCPDTAGTAATEGCPDADNDGIANAADQCPNEPEDKDSYRDDDGCPDLDNDGDGIPDLMDKCPMNPGTAETEGCPKTKEIQRGSLVLKGVNFETGKATLLPSSSKVLDEVALSLREWPEVRLEIQGHTDSRGNPDKNMELSRQRAETVRQYLVDKGVTADRLTAAGYGQDRPVADNKTASGRAMNRRVEINRQ